MWGDDENRGEGVEVLIPRKVREGRLRVSRRDLAKRLKRSRDTIQYWLETLLIEIPEFHQYYRGDLNDYVVWCLETLDSQDRTIPKVKKRREVIEEYIRLNPDHFSVQSYAHQIYKETVSNELSRSAKPTD